MVRSVNEIWHLFKKDVLLEIRQQYIFYGIVLYVSATIFVLYLSVENPESRVWNALFWVIQLFICINAVAKSFLQESRGRLLYFQTLVSPQNFILAILLFNGLLMLLMSVLSFLLFLFFLGIPAVKFLQFFSLVFLGGISLSFVFTFLAAIAAKANQNAAIMAILGFPLIIPQLLQLIQISKAAFSISSSFPVTNILLLVA
ncbi:MAG: heme exporter protein CcmB, partial [Chitinophagaceae bacterium]|nr:heme exporter protein CcmB [Chitinophagaceae bacterium]